MPRPKKSEDNPVVHEFVEGSLVFKSHKDGSVSVWSLTEESESVELGSIQSPRWSHLVATMSVNGDTQRKKKRAIYLHTKDES